MAAGKYIRTDKIREKNSNSNKGHLVSNESRQKMSLSRKGKPMSKEYLESAIFQNRNKKISDKKKLRSNIRKLSDTDILARQIYYCYKRSAKIRGHIFDLTLHDFQQLLFNDCAYCGISPSSIRKITYRKEGGFILYNGIDRVENSIGYVNDNVVSCCKYCNQAKHVRSVEDFLNWVERVYNKMIGGRK